MRLAHLADIHIGHRQYGLDKREDDMIATLRHTLGEIGDSDVDAVLLPGDLFHSRDLRPKNLDRVEDALRECVPDDVRVLVSRGNHDENLSPRDVTWLSYLHRRGHIVLLEADLGGDTAAGFDPFDPDEPGEHAEFVDLPDADVGGPVRVFGLQWRGARTADALERVAREIRATNDKHGEPAYTALLGHFGMEDEVPALGGTITHTDLREVREVVDYLALGHIHKRYEAAGWIHNPGSPEAHDTQEGRDDWEHGYYLVELEPDTNADGPGALAHDPTHHASKRRAYHPIEFDVTPYDSPGNLEAAFHEHVREERDAIETRCERDVHTGRGGSRRPPLVDLRFTGTLQFSRSDLRTGELSARTKEACEALHVQTTVGVRTADVEALLAELEDDGAFVDGRLDTSVLERQVFETIATESEYGDRADDVADVLERAHAMAQDGENPTDVADTVSERRRELFPEMADDVTIDVPEDPLTDETDDARDTAATDDGANETTVSDATTTAGLGEFASPDGGDAE
ncbi:metallophosphoesterase family protein [Halococcus agarilyticus]|uniref:metallophosphoesterase family protein n=1 Tax=Halococcus agarilyticus TaxID=1232219 RepID=UPI00067829F4|nr:DNA repair exonuclease [Halococcus agarilyticus]